VGDGTFDWSLIDTNMAVARRYGLKFLIKIADRSWDGSNILPDYFPSQFVLPVSGRAGDGFISKRWVPYVYKRFIRIYGAIARRYASNPAFGGIATSETALGSTISTRPDYTVGAYETAITQIVTQTQAALTSGVLLLYLNFLPGGDSADMNKDARFALLQGVPKKALLVGGPDVTPDVP